jgi:dienelactone hydrolase
MKTHPASQTVQVLIDADDLTLIGDLALSPDARAVVVFAHGSGSSRHSPRNQAVARVLQQAGLGILLFDLLTREEEAGEARTGRLRFDIAFLARRLVAATRWLREQPGLGDTRVGYFGASTGAAAALTAAAHAGLQIGAVVSRGGRPDLAMEALPHVHAPTLLIVGENDTLVRVLNEQAVARLTCVREMAIVPGATHLFEEAGALDAVARLAARWFGRHLLVDTQVRSRPSPARERS